MHTAPHPLHRLLPAAVLLAALPAAGLFGLRGDPLAQALALALLVLSLGVHEAAHAWAALKCGDSTARDLGRLTLNPLPHIDLMWTIVIPALALFSSGFLFGGAKPVPVAFHRLRHPWRDMSLVALAGPASNLVLAALFLVLWKVFVLYGWYNGAALTAGARAHDLLPRVLDATISVNVLLVAFNLLPIPPLDGSRVMAWLLPSSLREAYVSLERFGLLLVFGLVFFVPPFQRLLGAALRTIEALLETAVSLGGRW